METVFHTTVRCDWVPESRLVSRLSITESPAVPVLPGTRMALDRIIQGRCVDLRQMSQAILSDVGATLQVLRLAGKEYGAQACTTRIEDHISDLGVDACMSAILGESLAVARDGEAVTSLWIHSAKVAHRARLIADETQLANPEEAYLAGLLHELGSLPAVLGWPSMETGPDVDSRPDFSSRALCLAAQWSLPRCIRRYFKYAGKPGTSSALCEIVRRAHLSTTVPARASRSFPPITLRPGLSSYESVFPSFEQVPPPMPALSSFSHQNCSFDR